MTFGDYMQLIVWLIVCVGTIVGYRYQINELRKDLSEEIAERKKVDEDLWAEHHRVSDRLYNHVNGHN